MTTATPLPAGATRRGNPRSWSPDTAVPGMPAIGAAGIAEIKPHTRSGIADGLKQLRKRSAAMPPTPTGTGPHQHRRLMLVTYLPRDVSFRPVRTGTAHQLTLQAVVFDQGAVPADARNLTWIRFQGKPILLPATIPFPRVEEGGFFGAAVERTVRAAVAAWVVRTAKRTLVTGTGGPRPGPDVEWKEVAEFYSELASELRDPLLAELAAELSRL